MVMRTAHRRDEQGASLVIVLVFVIALSLVIGAVLYASSTSQSTTVATSSITNAVYAADSGVEFGLAKLKAANGFCPDMDLPPGFAGGQPVTVTCGGADSADLPPGAGSYAVITFNPGPDSLTSRSGNGVQKQASGRVFVNGGFNLQSKLRVNVNPPDQSLATWPLGDGQGIVRQRTQAGCVAASPPTNLITPNFACTDQTVDSIDPKPALPAALPPARASQPANTVTGVDGSTCAIFLPGTYATINPAGTPSRPNPLGLLGGPNTANYLASGVYYFHNLGQINLDDFRVFAGDLDGVPRELTNPPCTDDATAGVTSGEKGVQVILGGNTWLNVQSADAEFAAYRPASGGAGRGVSIRTVPTTGAGPFTPSVPGGVANGMALINATSTLPHFSVHGLVYAPNGTIEINDTNSSAAMILGGVMGWSVAINASASSSALVIQVTGERIRSRSKVIIEASVPVSSSKTVKSRAVVDVNVDPPSRTSFDGELVNGSTVVRLPTATLTAQDVGAAIYGGSIPARSYITAYNDLTKTVTMSVAATTSVNPAEITIDPSTRYVTDGEVTSGSNVVRSVSANFSSKDVGAGILSLGSSPGCPNGRVPDGTSIESLGAAADTVVISQPACSTQTGVLLAITSRRVTVSVDSWRIDNPS
jgi:hypothetical protein